MNRIRDEKAALTNLVKKISENALKNGAGEEESNKKLREHIGHII